LIVNPSAAEFSLPLTPAFFQYFNHENVKNRLTVQVNGSGDNRTLVATLTLPLEGETPQGPRGIKVSKEYSLAPNYRANTGGVAPGFALWPDFYSESWTHNMAAYRGPNDTPPFQAAPLFAGGRTGIPSRVHDETNPNRDLCLDRCRFTWLHVTGRTHRGHCTARRPAVPGLLRRAVPCPGRRWRPGQVRA